MVFAIDLGLYAVELKVGFYVKIMFIKIKFKKVKLCLKLLFTSFCLVMKIPIGFEFDFVEDKVSWPIPGKTLAEVRVFEQKILSVGF